MASPTDWSPGDLRREAGVEATRIGVQTRAEGLDKVERGLKGFGADLACIKGEMGPSAQMPVLREGYLTLETH